jgi:hypothetical protein
MKFEGRWVHCLSCDRAAIRCPYCDNLSCTGGGCDRCHDDFEAVMNMSEDEIPSTYGLPKTGGGMDIVMRSLSDEALAEQARMGISTNEWIEREHEKLILRYIVEHESKKEIPSTGGNK